MNVVIIKGAISKEHVHLLVSCPPSLSVSKLVQQLKGKTSRVLLSEYKELREDDLGVVYDLNDVYASATGYERYPKAGIFVKSATLSNRQNEVVTILSVMRTNLTTFKTNPSLIKEKAEIFDFGLFGFEDVDLLSEEIDSIANDLTFADSAYDEIVALLEFLEIPFSETYILH